MRKAAPSPSNLSTALPSRFYSLDALRGLAALCVVVCHWHFLFFDGTKLGPFVAEKQPFYPLLRPIYERGWLAVDFFFCLSGFIFFCYYSERIAARRIGPGAFAALRISRLYPLHLATLLAVALGQWFMRIRFGESFVSSFNDGFHFVINLLFASGWGFERGGSFNGPAWSISVEMLLYAAFFAACWFGLRRWWHLTLLAGAGLAIEFTRFCAVGRGLFGFFIGGLCYLFVSTVRRRGHTIRPALLLAGAAGAWLLVALDLRYHLTEQGLGAILGPHRLLRGHEIGDVLQYIAFQLFPFQVLSIPATIVAFALLESARGTLGKRAAFLGDISYSSYLLHFPLLLTLNGLARSFGWDRTAFYLPGPLLLFLAALLALAWCCHRWFELPAQAYLRSHLITPSHL